MEKKTLYEGASTIIFQVLENSTKQKTIYLHEKYVHKVDVEISMNESTAVALQAELNALFPGKIEPSDAIHDACLHNYNESGMSFSDIVDYAYKLGRMGKQPVFNQDTNIWE